MYVERELADGQTRRIATDTAVPFEGMPLKGIFKVEDDLFTV
jgi:hypothetical protein